MAMTTIRIPESVNKEFRQAIAQYTHGKEFSIGVAAAMLSFLDLDHDARLDYIQQAFMSRVSQRIDVDRQAAREQPTPKPRKRPRSS
ncbi:MAG: hypothetical protein AAGI68_12230 [Planctomycetota bacterium]